MDKYLNSLLELPATINQMLPRNNLMVMDGSEKSVKGWVVLCTVFALVFLVSMLYAVIQTGLDHFGGASSISKVGSGAILLYIYAAFPLAQII